MTVLALRLAGGRAHIGRLAPGLIAAGVTAAAASFLSEHYGAPVMLFALLLGLAMNSLPLRPSTPFRCPREEKAGPLYAFTSTMKSGSKAGFSLTPPRA